MTKEEAYIYIGRLERLADVLSALFKHGTDAEQVAAAINTLLGEDVEAFADYAEGLCAFVRASRDEQVMIDCCKIKPYYIRRYCLCHGIEQSMSKIRDSLDTIHDMALSEIWGVSCNDIATDKYYIDSAEGVCRNSKTGELLPRPVKPVNVEPDAYKSAEQRLTCGYQHGMDTPDSNKPTDLNELFHQYPEADTDRARKYIGRAVEVGYITPTDRGYKWLMGGRRGALARLGYFVERIYCPSNTETLPEKAINNLFGVVRIGSAITQLNNAKKPQKWRTEIDDKIFYD